jgi:hypothetical protein
VEPKIIEEVAEYRRQKADKSRRAFRHLLAEVADDVVGLLGQIEDAVAQTLTIAVGPVDAPRRDLPQPAQTAEDGGLARS